MQGVNFLARNFPNYRYFLFNRLSSSSSRSPPSRISAGYRALKTAFRVASATVVTFCVGNTFFTLVGYPACVSGASMRPALNDALNTKRQDPADSSALSWLQLKVNWVFVNCWQARGYEFHRGEIVVFVSPKGTQTLI